MPSVALSDPTIRALQPLARGQITYWDKSLPGFGVRVSPGGAKTFVLVHGPERRRTTVGRYPTISLKEARGEARRMLAERTLGIAEDKVRTVTFAEARAHFLTAKAQSTRPRTVEDYRARLDRHFRYGQKLLADITRRDIQTRLGKLSHTPSEQNHAYVALRTLLNWAVQEQLLEASPMAGMQMPSLRPSRERVLSEAELKTVYEAALAFPYPFGPLVSLLLLTGQRRGEVVRLEWDWIDRDDRIITFPARVTKNGHTHSIPYGDHTAKVLAGVPNLGPLLFPSRNKNGSVFNGWAKSKRQLDEPLGDVAPYTLHDLRRTFASTLASLGIQIHVTEKLLNHKSGVLSGIAAIYNRYTYLDEMRAAVTRYDYYLLNIKLH